MGFPPNPGPTLDPWPIQSPTMTDADAPQPDEKPEKEAPHPNFFVRQWRGWVKQVLIVIVVVTVARSMIMDWNDVPTGSMNPTILEGDRIVVNKLAYDLRVPFTTWRLARWSEPKRGDIITFWEPTKGIRMVKRTIGVPGDTIEIKGGRLLITDADGNPVPVTYQDISPNPPRYVTLRDNHGRPVRSPIVDAEEDIDGNEHTIQYTVNRPVMRDYGPITLGPDEFWTMGDNRDNSRDSRFFREQDNGAMVNARDITGHAFATAWSLNDSWLPRWRRFFKSLN